MAAVGASESPAHSARPRKVHGTLRGHRTAPGRSGAGEGKNYPPTVVPLEAVLGALTGFICVGNRAHV